MLRVFLQHGYTEKIDIKNAQGFHNKVLPNTIAFLLGLKVNWKFSFDVQQACQLNPSFMHLLWRTQYSMSRSQHHK